MYTGLSRAREFCACDIPLCIWHFIILFSRPSGATMIFLLAQCVRAAASNKKRMLLGSDWIDSRWTRFSLIWSVVDTTSEYQPLFYERGIGDSLVKSPEQISITLCRVKETWKSGKKSCTSSKKLSANAAGCLQLKPREMLFPQV